MPNALAESLQQTIDREFKALRGLTDDESSHSLREGWSRKEELGHLLDSAANNHMRFVMATLEDNYHGMRYDQNAWVRVHGYGHMPWEALTSLWHAYNTLIAELVRRIPEERLPTPCQIGDGAPVTLGFLIEDYVVHMQHHIDAMLGREIVTRYPQVTVHS